MQRPSKDEVRAEFVGIASRRFAADGFQATSLDDIAGDAGYSKAAVLYHFGSKDDLLVAVMQRHIDETGDLVESLENLPAGPGRTETSIAQLVSMLLSRRPDVPFTMNPAHDLATAASRHPDLMVRFRETRERMARLLVGDDATLEQRVRLVIAFSGIPALLIELRDVPAEHLHGPICDVLRDAVYPKETP